MKNPHATTAHALARCPLDHKDPEETREMQSEEKMVNQDVKVHKVPRENVDGLVTLVTRAKLGPKVNKVYRVCQVLMDKKENEVYQELMAKMVNKVHKVKRVTKESEVPEVILVKQVFQVFQD